ncbi:MAG: hypothetical protein ACREIT_02830 [Tepidisphaeraceae bacterium]
MTETATFETVPTPCVVVDLPAVKRNLKRMADYCQQHGLKLRPHSAFTLCATDGTELRL